MDGWGCYLWNGSELLWVKVDENVTFRKGVEWVRMGRNITRRVMVSADG